LSVKEQKRLVVVLEVEAGRMIGREAAEVLGLSLRQVRRLIAAYQKEGPAGLAHGNRGRACSCRCAPRGRVRESVVCDRAILRSTMNR
jgi:transposase